MDHFHNASGDQASLVGGEDGCSGDLPFLCKAPGPRVSHSSVSALHLHALAGSHSQVVTEMTPLLVPVLCLVLSCDQMPDKNNRKKDWFGHRLESSVHQGREGGAEQEDPCQCSRETEQGKSAKLAHGDTVAMVQSPLLLSILREDLCQHILLLQHRAG